MVDLTARSPVGVSPAVVAVCSGCGHQIRPGAGWLTLDVHAAMDVERTRTEFADRSGGLITIDMLVDEWPERESWKAWHRSCDPDLDRDIFRYSIDADQITTWPKVAGWTAHLMEKSWLAATDWVDVLRHLAEGDGGLLREVR